MADTQDLPEVATLTYEQARDELVRLVAMIESGDVPLEQAMQLWERGEELAAHCQGKLDHAQQRLEERSGADSDTSGGQESPGQEAPDQDPPDQESADQDPPGQDPPGQESADQDPPGQGRVGAAADSPDDRTTADRDR